MQSLRKNAIAETSVKSLLLILFLGICFCASSQKIDLNRSISPVVQNLKKKYNVLKNVPIKVEKYDIDLDKEVIDIKFTKHIEGIPLRPQFLKDLNDSIKSLLPEPLNEYDINLYVSNYKLDELVPNFYRDKRSQDKHRRPKGVSSSSPISSNLSKPYDVAKGLADRHIAIWQSHGWYFEQSKDRWLWQRPYLFQVVEDSYTMSYVVPYLVPMLENAGAYVFLPRERDTQKNEVIVDNDTSMGRSAYKEVDGLKVSWESVDSVGFANRKDVYYDNENPFKMGSYRRIPSKKNGRASVEWIPDIPEKGDYAVYISYASVPESSDDARYTVFHTGGTTEFSVNQTMGGGAWVYLGTFNFDQGCNDLSGKVRLTNASHANNRVVTADAVRFGGGMGNIARNKLPNPKNKKGEPSELRVSGRARYLEGARYWLQWSGFSPSVYNLNDSRNDYKDDYMCRGEWVNALSGGSFRLPGRKGKKIPVDMAMGFHSDAGYFPTDSIVGTLSIYMTETNNGLFKSEQHRLASRDLADLVQTQIAKDVRTLHNPKWVRRKLTDQSYYECRVPEVPSFLLELLSHQNFEDMRYGLDPHFRFDVCRAVYKGILKFLSSQYGTDYVVQPLPVKNFSCDFYSMDRKKAFLAWEDQPDSLESSAMPEKYVVYTAVGDGGFDNGVVTSSKNIILPIDTGKIYRFKVTAINDGGESFPSETLSICNMPQSDKVVLVVNGFHRLSAPESFDTGDYAGFLMGEDQGVPFGNEFSYVGPQYDFTRKSKFKSNEEAGFGGCYNAYETQKIAGNTFDYPYVHGKAIQRAGCSFASCSKESFVEGKVVSEKFFCVDYIAGEEKETVVRGKKQFRIFDDQTKDAMSDYLKRGGNLFLSGAYIGSDIWMRDSVCDDMDIRFAEEFLRFRLTRENAGNDGVLTSFFSLRKEFSSDFSYYATLNSEMYAVESPNAIEPVNGSFEVLNFSNNMAACVAAKGKYRTVVSTVPFETIKSDESRSLFMKEIIDFFCSKW